RYYIQVFHIVKGDHVRGFEDKPGKRIPKAGAYVSTGVGLARAEWSIFEAEARGPNATAGAGASAVSGAGAFARAELGSASASAGPLVAKLGLAADTGIQVGPAGLEAKILGTSFTFGPRPSISLLGSELECVIC
uniref:Uncharacterized protein n=1 Tax=Anabas testudineus TaxID=64144 RepID=A0A3Q1HSW0_ANATE